MVLRRGYWLPVATMGRKKFVLGSLTYNWILVSIIPYLRNSIFSSTNSFFPYTLTKSKKALLTHGNS